MLVPTSAAAATFRTDRRETAMPECPLIMSSFLDCIRSTFFATGSSPSQCCEYRSSLDSSRRPTAETWRVERSHSALDGTQWVRHSNHERNAQSPPPKADDHPPRTGPKADNRMKLRLHRA